MNKEGIIKHRAVFEAWLEGKAIEWKDAGRDWKLVGNPNFTTTAEYRVKPEPREFWVNMYNNSYTTGVLNEGYLHMTEASALRGKSNGAGRTDITTIKVREILE